MLRITVELLPGGRTAGRRVIAVGEIGRIRNGASANYEVSFEETLLPDAVMSGEVLDYPRWSASIWDLVARALCVALSGEERLPVRPTVPNVPIYRSEAGGVAYLRLRDIPEPARTFFIHHIRYETRPIVTEVPDPLDCAHLWEWEGFLNGGR